MSRVTHKPGPYILHCESFPQVWYHGQWCKSRGRNCWNTRETSHGGCCVWNDDQKMLADIEEHLGVTIPQTSQDMTVEVDEFDGKVVYGKKRVDKGAFIEVIFCYHINSKSNIILGSGYVCHASQLEGVLSELQRLEKEAQLVFLQK